MPEPHLRAADTDREAVAAALGEHMAAGRLTLAEYDERLARVYAARTYGELDELTADLPRPVPAPAQDAPGPASTPAPVPQTPMPGRPGSPSQPHPAASAGWHGADNSWRGWLGTSLIVLTIYLAVSLGNGTFEYFWPIWVIGPWGAVLLAQRLTRGRHDDGRPGLER
jgi:hypothetical protein